MDYTVQGILQARILERVAFPFSRGSSQQRDQTQISHIAGGLFTSWATREAQEYWSGSPIPSPVDLPYPGINWGLLHCRWILYNWTIREAPKENYSAIKKKKGWKNVICSNLDRPRDYHTKWSKPERERQIPYDTTYMQNLKRWHKWTYLWKRLTDMENKLIVTKADEGGKGRRDKSGDWD